MWLMIHRFWRKETYFIGWSTVHWRRQTTAKSNVCLVEAWRYPPALDGWSRGTVEASWYSYFPENLDCQCSLEYELTNIFLRANSSLEIKWSKVHAAFKKWRWDGCFGVCNLAQITRPVASDWCVNEASILSAQITKLNHLLDWTICNVIF